MTSQDSTPLAAIRLHPAIVVMSCFGVAVAGRRAWALELPGGQEAGITALGMGIIGVGLLTLVLAYGEMARARTTIDPRQHTSTLVTSGVYRLSRNPIYLGWFLFTGGLGVVNLSPFPVAVAGLMLGLLDWSVVIKEETYLEALFGEEYRRYKRVVRRWI